MIIIECGQIYLEPDVSFPFSHVLQLAISDYLSKNARNSTDFEETYSSEYQLNFSLSAKSDINFVDAQGPIVSKKYKDVEYVINAPFRYGVGHTQESWQAALNDWLDGIINVLDTLQFDTSRIRETRDDFVRQVMSDPAMIDQDELDEAL